RQTRHRARGGRRSPRLRPELERSAAEGRVRARQRRQAPGLAGARPRGLVMRILGLSGSLRRDSHNTRLLRGAAKLLPAGAELELFDGLADIPPYSEDAERSHTPAAV